MLSVHVTEVLLYHGNVWLLLSSMLLVCSGPGGAHAVEHFKPVLLLLSIMDIMIQTMVLACFSTVTCPWQLDLQAVTRNELYGYLHPSTREWKEGLMSVTYRDMSNNKTNKHQWIVLDGDIDAEWIESMNTVMDDNKMLTLASNERIPLTASMRLLLEINHMNHCSPATVSRGGVIYVNADDVGWKPVRCIMLLSLLVVYSSGSHGS